MRFCFPHQFGIENCNLIESTINIPGTCNRRWTVQLMQKIIVLFFEIHGIYVDFCCLISVFLMIRLVSRHVLSDKKCFKCQAICDQAVTNWNFSSIKFSHQIDRRAGFKAWQRPLYLGQYCSEPSRSQLWECKTSPAINPSFTFK